MVKFVNPYTFLPLPKAIKRQEPHYHDGKQAKERPLYTGSFTVEWELKSPLLLPVDAEKEGWLEPLAEPRSEEEEKQAPDELRKISIPGSSVKGALRSLHEAAFFGCMSVIDQEYIPAYREAARKGKRATSGAGWRIGVVTEVDENGRPTMILPGEGKTIWLNAKDLKRIRQYRSRTGESGENLPRTGDVIKFKENDLRNDNGRLKKDNLDTAGEFIGRGKDCIGDMERDCHVVIITHGGTRGKMKKWFWASQKIDHAKPALPVTEEALESLLAKVAGTDDSRKKKAREKNKENESSEQREDRLNAEYRNSLVQGLGEDLGIRLLQHGQFEPGDALWVQVRDGEVIELSYSAIWRRVAQRNGRAMKVADLAGELGPCDPNSYHEANGGVCMSCSIFGIVGKENNKGEEGRGYAGHIRVGSLHLTDNFAQGVTVRSEPEFMPLASPKQSNAQFYLTNPRVLQGTPSAEEVEAGENSAHWDRRELKNFQKELAGRKFYWNHNPLREPSGGGHPYYKAFKDANEELKSSRKFVLPEVDGNAVRLVGEIIFDQITAAELLSLWYLFDHASMFSRLEQATRDSSVVRIGGGKPLGFGAVKPKITKFNVSTLQHRYISADPEFEGNATTKTVCGVGEETENAWFDELIDRVVPPNGAGVKLDENIGRLGRVMDLEGLGPDKAFVSYPPNAPWSEYGKKKFHESYAFFMGTNGAAYSGGWQSWVPLPKLSENGKQVIDNW